MVLYNVIDQNVKLYPFGIIKLRDGLEMPKNNVKQLDDILKNNISSIIKDGNTAGIFENNPDDNTAGIFENNPDDSVNVNKKDISEGFVNLEELKSDYTFRKAKIAMSIVFLLVILFSYLFSKIK